MRVCRLLLVSILATLAALPLSSEEITFENASFELPDKPLAVVLYLAQYSQDMSTRSMTVFADGRIELRFHYGSAEQAEPRMQQVDRAQVEAWIEDAIRHGLAEWDPPRIMARQLDASQGRIRHPPEDGPRFTMMLAVEKYQRGDFVVEPLQIEIRIGSPTIVAEIYPSIPELQGVAKMATLLHERFKIPNSAP